jgi:hypothetical protein
LTGALMAVLLWIAQVALITGALLGFRATEWTPFRALAWLIGGNSIGGDPTQVMLLFVVASVLLMTTFLSLLRIFPWLAGYHAAEHQTVNAIEAGEPLTLDAVAKMPRVHPRCGTNLGALMGLGYLGVAILAMALSLEAGRQHIEVVATLALWSVLAVVISWKRLGAWMQTVFTTRTATPREIASGIKAGTEVLGRARLVLTPPTPFMRIWHMGLLQVAMGLMLTGWLLDFLTAPLDAWWQSLVK